MSGSYDLTPAARRRLVRLELLHAAAAIERARLLARHSSLEPDIVRLLEFAHATADLADAAIRGETHNATK